MPSSDPRGASGPATPGGPTGGITPAAGSRGYVRQVTWALVPLLTLGLLAFVPFLRLALGRRRPRDWQVFCGYLVADVVAVVLVSVTTDNSSGATLAGSFLLLLAGFGTVEGLRDWLLFCLRGPLATAGSRERVAR